MIGEGNESRGDMIRGLLSTVSGEHSIHSGENFSLDESLSQARNGIPAFATGINPVCSFSLRSIKNKVEDVE